MAARSEDQLFQQALAAHRAGRLGDAVNLYRGALAADPRNAAAHHNLGLIILRRGNPTEAETLFRQAATLVPAMAEYAASLSNALRALGRADDARAAAARAIALQPNFVDAHLSLALALVDLDKIAEAERAFAQLFALDPKHGDGLISLGTLRLRQGRLADAEQLLVNAVRLRPNYAPAYLRLGDLFAAQGKGVGAVEAYRRARTLDAANTEALEKYTAALASAGGADAARRALEQAVEREPGSPKAHELLADFLSSHGYIDDAATQFRKAVELDPENLGLRSRLVQHVRIASADDPDVAALRAAYDLAPADGEQRESLAFVLGKAFDDLGETGRAFDYYSEGNRLTRAHLDYSLTAAEKNFVNTATAFTAAFIARHRGEGDPTTAPIFIVGMPRSGTTLTEQILAAHPDVFAAGELDFVRKAAIAVLGFEPFTGALRFAQPGQSLDFAAIGRTYLDWLSNEARSKPHFTDKLPQNFLLVGLIRLAFPNAKIVHVHRDPLDNCLSIFKARFAAGAIGFGYHLTELGGYFKLYRALMQHWNDVLPGEIFDLSYEALVSDPEATSRALLAFCGLDWRPEILEFHKGRGEVRTASFAQVRRPINRDSVNTAERYGSRLDPLRAALAD